MRVNHVFAEAEDRKEITLVQKLVSKCLDKVVVKMISCLDHHPFFRGERKLLASTSVTGR